MPGGCCQRTARYLQSLCKNETVNRLHNFGRSSLSKKKHLKEVRILGDVQILNFLDRSCLVFCSQIKSAVKCCFHVPLSLNLTAGSPKI